MSAGKEVAVMRSGNGRPKLQDDVDALRSTIRGPVRIAYGLIIVFLVGFVAWAVVVPIAGGAVASGIISPDGSRRTVQHFEGGIVRALLVRDGDAVAAGEPLLELENVQPKATRDMLAGQLRTLLATQARLEAERAGLEDFALAPEAIIRWGPQTRDAERTQRDLMRARREAHESRLRVLRQRIVQLEEQIAGFTSQVESATRQLELIAEELEGKQILLEKGIMPKPEILRLQRAEAEIGGRRGEYLSAIARARQQIGETELELLSAEAERADAIASQLVDVESELASVREKLLASEDVLERTIVSAPVSGVVVDLRIKTVGGVVRAGEPILDLVPSDDALVIDAQVAPRDIDVVAPGLLAQIHLSAFSSRSMPRIDGTVRSVSADRLVDQQSGRAYYLARVEVNRERLAEVDSTIELVPGMPADVLIVTGERTLVDYLFQPFLDAVRRSFREV